ncbi:MAG: HU family DNA-binding protein [Actinotalea sp.]|nr:HU family DNA-binding protein [Actinotalea sp.]
MTLNRSDVVEAIADRAGLSAREADAALTALRDVVVEALREGRAVKVAGFVSVDRTERPARTGRNPRTGEPLEIPAGYTVRVAAGSALKDAVREVRP